MPRVFLDDLFAVNSARLRAMGVIRPDASSALVSFGQGEDALVREIGTWHRKWSHGRGLSLFLCPNCGGKAQILRLWAETPWCRRCLLRQKITYRICSGSAAEKAEARRARIEKLRARLEGGSPRLHPLPGRGIERRKSLELSLKRAMVVERQAFMKVGR
jgi:hypothetical protein